MLSVHPSIFFPFPFPPYFIISGVRPYLSNVGISLPDRLQTSAGNEITALISPCPLRLQDKGATHLSPSFTVVNYFARKLAILFAATATKLTVFMNFRSGSKCNQTKWDEHNLIMKTFVKTAEKSGHLKGYFCGCFSFFWIKVIF